MPVPFPASRENQVGRVSDTRGRRGSLEDFRAVHGVSAREPLGGTNGDAFRGGRASGNVLSIITRDETCQRRSCRLCLMRIDFRIAFPREPGITDTLVLSRDLWRPPDIRSAACGRGGGPLVSRGDRSMLSPARRLRHRVREPQGKQSRGVTQEHRVRERLPSEHDSLQLHLPGPLAAPTWPSGARRGGRAWTERGDGKGVRPALPVRPACPSSLGRAPFLPRTCTVWTVTDLISCFRLTRRTSRVSFARKP